MRIKGLCKECKCSFLRYSYGGKRGEMIPTAVCCNARNGRIKKPPKQCELFVPKEEI